MNIRHLLKSVMLNTLNEGTSHWLTQRLSSFLLIPLTGFFIFSFVQHVGLSYDDNMLIYKNPIRAFFTFLFFSLTLLHFKQGAQVIIEDYIHNDRFHRVLLKTNLMFFLIMNFVILSSLIKIVFDNNGANL